MIPNVIVRSRSKEAFQLAMKLAFMNTNNMQKCIGYAIKNNELFLSQYSKECTLFAYEFNIEQTIEFAWGWWNSNKNPTEREPDTDGSTAVGFEISTERSGVGSKDWGMFVSIKSVWFVYGK